MTDPKKPEKDSGNKPANSTAAMKNQDNALEVLRLQEQLKTVKDELKKVGQERDEANAVIANDIKARKIKELLDISDYTVEDVDDWTIQELDATLKHIRMAKSRMVKSVADMGGAVKSPQSSMDDIYGQSWLKK